MLNEIQCLHQAIEFQKQGMLDKAEDLYRQILRENPDQSDAKHLLGLIACKRGDFSEALRLIREAIRKLPTNAVFVGNLGVVLRQSGRIDEAIEAYQTAIQLDPKSSDLHFNLGKSMCLKGRYTEAETAFRMAVTIQPSSAWAWLSLTNACSAQNQWDRAFLVAIEALKACPKAIELQLSLAAMMRRKGLLEDALKVLKQALVFHPSHVELLSRLASIHLTCFQFEAGEMYLNRAKNLAPNNVHVINAEGLFHRIMGNMEGASTCYRRSIEQFPEFSTAYANLAGVLRKKGEFTASLEYIDKSLAQKPNDAESLTVRGGTLVCLGRLDEAEIDFRNAIRLRSGYRDAHDNLLMCRHYQSDCSAASLFVDHLEWSRQYAANLSINRKFHRPPSNKPLKIGFVSADLGAHPVGYFTAQLFESLDTKRFQSYVYSDRLGRDWLAKRIEQHVHCWRDTSAMCDESLANQIVSDEIDILLDLSGHTAQNRLLVFARRAAPVQVSWAGYVGTTGVQEIDYLLADRFHVPVDCEAFYNERILRMPNGYVSYCAPLEVDDVVPLPAKSNAMITFGAMCNPAKVNRNVLRLWSEILHRVPGSKLLLCYAGWNDVANQKRVLEGLAGSTRESQVLFDVKENTVSTMNLYGRVDIALDTFPYSGGLTTCEAMWMGVPTITLPGQTFAGRHSLSHLSNVGLNECIARSEQDYIEKAVELAFDLDRLATLRAGLRIRVKHSPLGDGPKFARDFELLMHQIWDDYQAGCKSSAEVL